MERKPVESSNINSVGYDEETKTLEIEFNTGTVYQYSPVTLAGYNDFMGSESKGKYFHAHIRNNENISVEQIT